MITLRSTDEVKNQNVRNFLIAMSASYHSVELDFDGENTVFSMLANGTEVSQADLSYLSKTYGFRTEFRKHNISV